MGIFDFIKSLFMGNNKKSKTNLILFGPPGSGKGTQAVQLAEKYNLIHISTGDLFRYELGNNTPLGLKAREYMDKGKLVPDEVTIGMLKNRIDKDPDCEGFIFDGFPRTIPQAEALGNLLSTMGQKVSALISLKVEEDEIVQRLLERGKISGRADDANEEVIRNRIAVYEKETAPVYAFYDKIDLAKEVSGMGTISDIQSRLSELFESI